MKVMGSAVMVFEAIVIGLAMPVAIVNGDYNKSLVLTAGCSLMLLAILSVGSIRRDRTSAIKAGYMVQAFVFAAGYFVRPFLIPAVIFTLCWILAVKLSEKTDQKSV